MNIDQQYLDLVRKIINEGEKREDRTGTGTLSLFGESLSFDLSDGLPLLNTKQVGWKWALVETLWMFVQGSSDLSYLKEHNVSIWDEWEAVDKTTGLPTIGNVYGPVLRGNVQDGVDQIQYVIDLLKNDPFSRRICMSAWDPRFIPLGGTSFQDNVNNGKGVLAPCHSSFIQFYVSKKTPKDVTKELIKSGLDWDSFNLMTLDECINKYNLSPYKLDAQTVIRSNDVALGLPFNILQISYVVHMLSQITGYSAGTVKYLMGDAHVYLNQLDGLSEQLKRTPWDSYPDLIIDTSVKDYNDFKLEHFSVKDYKHQGKISMPVSI